MEAVSGGGLIGREQDQARLTELIGHLPATGGALALVGGPGAGRSALLSWLSGRAGAHGIRVLTATPARNEADLPYAGLRRLLPRLPWSEAPTGVPPGRAAVSAFDLVVELAGNAPLLLTVDDAQWLDPASWAVLTFIARRVTHHPAVIVAALREDATTTARLRGAGLPGLALGPLGPPAARLLLDRHAPGLRPAQRDQVLALAQGNPLGLVELAAAVRPAPAGADLPLTTRLVRAFAAAADGLPAPVRTLLEVAALGGGSSADEMVAAARRLDPEVRPGDLAVAEAAWVITVEEPFELRFRHPLTRVAIRYAMSTARHREVHKALADVLDAHPARQIRHRAEAAAGPDEGLAAQLSATADEAHRQGAVTAAARTYERAAQLSEDRRKGTDRMLWAVASAYDAGDPATARRLFDALPRDRRVLPGGESLPDLLRTAGARLRGGGGPVLPGLGMRALEFFLSGPDRLTRDAVVAAAREPAPGIAEASSLCVLALADPAGRCAEVLPLIRRHARDLTGSPGDLDLVALAGLGVGAMPETIRLSATATGRLRGQGASGLLARSLAVQATAAAQVGNVLLAEECAAEAGRLSAETGQPLWLRIADLARARAAALRGDAATALSLVAGAPNPPALARLVRGSVAAAGDRPESACDELAPLVDPAASAFHREIGCWALPTLAEAAVACGRTQHLHGLLAGLEPLRTAGLPVADVALAYADAALADTEQAYTAALAHPDLPAWPFELSRLHLAYGGWLRRHRRPAAARRHLRAAAQTFTLLGAHPWATRAGTGLRAAGERVSPGQDLRELLTPRELQIAVLAADGLGNREIGARLQLSSRSVDSHLSRAYRKAGASSRAELTRLLLATG